MPTVEYLNYEILDDHGWDINDDDLFEKASEADLSRENHGSLTVGEGDFILDAVEAANLEWPYSCRTAACANCAAKVVDGDVDMAMQMILSDEEVRDKDLVLTCVGTPGAEDVQLVYNVKHLDYLLTRVV